MKLFARIISVILIVLTLSLTLVSCGGVDKGEYIMGDKVLDGYYEGYTFKGNKFSYNVYIAYQAQEELCYSGKYKLEKNKEESNKDEGLTVGTITLTYLDAEGNEVVEEKSYAYYEEEGKMVIGDLIYKLFIGDDE